MSHLILHRRVRSGVLVWAALILSVALASCAADPAAAPTATREGGAIETLQIDLQEGFANDRVAITVNGQVVFDEVVTTNLMHGLAATVEAEVPRGQTRVEVQIAARNLAETIPLDVSGTVYLGIAVRDGAIEHRISDQPFPYA